MITLVIVFNSTLPIESKDLQNDEITKKIYRKPNKWIRLPRPFPPSLSYITFGPLCFIIILVHQLFYSLWNALLKLSTWDANGDNNDKFWCKFQVFVNWCIVGCRFCLLHLNFFFQNFKSFLAILHCQKIYSSLKLLENISKE